MRYYSQIPLQRKKNLLILIFFTFIILIGKYFNIQVLEYNEYVHQSRKNSIRQVKKRAPRGIIYDSNNNPLVDNRPIFDLQIIPEDVKEKFNYDKLNKITGINKEKLKVKIKKQKKSINRFKPTLVKRHLSYTEMSKLQENRLDFPGMVFSQLPARIYPNSAKLSHVLGYLREVTEKQLNNPKTNIHYQLRDIYGAIGLEKQYESTLRGIDGYEYHTVDLYGRDHGIILTEKKYNQKSGKPLHITIDSRLQYMVEQRMEGLTGALICMNPTNGNVLAMASTPDFDLSSFVGPISTDIWSNWNSDDKKPLMNRVINGTYPPGSIFKIITAAMILETDRIDSNEMYFCSGVYHFGDRDYHCWNDVGHGEVDLSDAIKYSCNIYFYNVIQKFNLNEWAEMSNRFGFGMDTGIDLQNESIGIIPTREYMNKKYTSRGWAFGSLLNFVMGQGDILTTPIQVVQMMNLIVKGGTSGIPRLKKNEKIIPLTLDLNKDTWKFIQNALWRVVNEDNGTGNNARILKNGVVSGKTGTAQNPHGDPHSWFGGYIILDSKEAMTIAVIIENGGKGSAIAAPIAKDVFTEFLRLNNPILF